MEKKIALELTKKTKDDLKRYKFIGAEIKSSRLKLSKTLDAIGNVNKSISYISKIENNKIIPNERCLEELCAELQIPQSDLESMSKFDECILEALDAIYMLDYDKMEELYNLYSSFTNIRTNLMKGLYFYMFDKHKEIKKVALSLEKIEGSLSIEDYLVYVLICIKDLILDRNIVQAYKVAKVVIESQTAKGVIDSIFKMVKYELKCNFYLHCFESEYHDIIKMHVERANVKRIEQTIVIFNKQKVELLGIENNEDSIEKICDTGLQFYAYCLINNITKAKQLYRDDFEDEYKLFYYYKTKQIDNIIKMLSTKMTEENMILANSYKLEIEGNIDVYRTYLIDVCIKYFKDMVKIKHLIYFYEILVSLNSKVSKYKDSVIIGNEVVLLIQEVSRIIV